MPEHEAGETVAYVGMGSNVGDRLGTLQAALDRLDVTPGVRVDAVSAVYETEAHTLPGQGPQPDHLNAVARLVTSLPPFALHAALADAEQAAGRDAKAARWSPRPLDLDLLLYGDDTIEAVPEPGVEGPFLVVPHPKMAQRRFVLQPLADLAPGLVVPVVGQTVAEVLSATADAARLDRTELRLVVPRADRAR